MPRVPDQGWHRHHHSEQPVWTDPMGVTHAAGAALLNRPQAVHDLGVILDELADLRSQPTVPVPDPVPDPSDDDAPVWARPLEWDVAPSHTWTDRPRSDAEPFAVTNGTVRDDGQWQPNGATVWWRWQA